MKKHYHFIGIGGIGMSALARILLKRGDVVSGSDQKDSSIMQELKAEGAKIFIGHQKKNVKGADIVIYTSGISPNNEEFVFAKEKKIPLLHRSELLASILEGYAPVLVAGTHGKTTTSSLLAHTLLESHLDPSYAIGGYLNASNTNGRFGRGLYFVVEADESDGSFLNYPSFGGIITNVEHDHMEFWKTEEALLEAFKKFAGRIGSKNHLFWCRDDPLLASLSLKGHSYGFDRESDLLIHSFSQIGWKVVFDLSFEGSLYKEIEIPLIGAHNVLNAAAVFGLGRKLDISEDNLRAAFLCFAGVKRRIEKKGEVNQICIYDDYAHHPTEIFSTLRALKKASPKRRIVVAYQPHRYSRTKYCLDDYADAFKYADTVILTDIYAAGEPAIAEISAEKVVKRIKEGGYESIQFASKEDLIPTLMATLKPNDILLTMGAGDITHVGPELIKKLEFLHEK